jgi:hypothetical protein
LTNPFPKTSVEPRPILRDSPTQHP